MEIVMPAPIIPSNDPGANGTARLAGRPAMIGRI
jgi:hypothetical protein